MSAADCWLAAGVAAALSAVNAVLGYWLYLTF
jgi:hypothetical protein